MGFSFQVSSSSSMKALLTILFFSSKGMKFSMIRCLKEKKNTNDYFQRFPERLLLPEREVWQQRCCCEIKAPYLSFRSLVSSFWICSCSWRSWLFAVWVSRISDFTACSLENSWWREKEIKTMVTMTTRTHRCSIKVGLKCPIVMSSKTVY